MENAKILGVGLMTISSLLGAYYLILKIREFHSEKPDPKLTYSTIPQLERVRTELFRSVGEAVQDLRTLRAEMRDETRAIQKRLEREMFETRDTVSRLAESVSALAARSQMANQRIAELTLKTDRLAARSNRE